MQRWGWSSICTALTIDPPKGNEAFALVENPGLATEQRKRLGIVRPLLLELN